MGLFSTKKKFIFNKKEEDTLVQEIKDAELQTSGEIRIHVEPRCGDDSFKRALDLFKELGMHKTQLQNAVLIYIAYESHKFSIVAAQGINKVVPEHFWESLKDILLENFKNNDYLKGLKLVIQKTGEQLKMHFPYSKDLDENELEDSISK